MYKKPAPASRARTGQGLITSSGMLTPGRAGNILSLRMESTAGWQHFEHGADIGVLGYGETLAVAFEQAALALTAVVTDPERVAPVQSVTLHCEAPDMELLLTDWLNALIYEMAVRRMLFSRFAVEIQGRQLQATAWGEAVDIDRHQPAVEVKGATYTALQVRQDDKGIWTAQCVVDV